MQTSPLRLGSIVSLATLAIACLLGLIAVIDADNVATSFGTGFGIAFLVFLSGATIACALACLARGRLEWVALGSTVVAGLALDLVVLAIWREIDSETYARIALIASVLSFFALIILGLTLAVDRPERITRWLYFGAVGSTIGAALVSTYLIATTDGSSSESGSDTGVIFPTPVESVGEDELLRVLGVALVLLATFWFAAIAAHRLERAPAVDA